MRKKKVLIITLLIMALFLMATGCAKENEGLDMDVEDEQGQENNENNLENDENQGGQDTSSEEREGIFVGWIDGNSFEMDIDGETIAVRNEDNIEIPEDLEGKDVKVKLKRNAMNQYIIEKIDMKTP